MRTNTSCPARSSTVAIGGAPGPVTTISFTFVRVGFVKSTSFWRSGVTVTWAITRSTLPSVSAAQQLVARQRHEDQTWTFRLPVLSFLFSSSSKSLPYS